MVSAVAGVILLYLSNALSASAGLGGGSLNVPIYINVFGFSYHNATILSLCALMGNYLFQVLINLDKPHPTAVSSLTGRAKSLISWETVLILSPSEWGGSNLGVIFSESIPSTVLYITALVVLTVALVLSLHKGFALYRAENARFAAAAAAAAAAADDDDDGLPRGQGSAFHNYSSGTISGTISGAGNYYDIYRDDDDGDGSEGAPLLLTHPHPHTQHASPGYGKPARGQGASSGRSSSRRGRDRGRARDRIIPRYLYCYLDLDGGKKKESGLEAGRRCRRCCCCCCGDADSNSDRGRLRDEYAALDSAVDLTEESNEEDDGDGWDMDIEVPWLLVSVIFAMWVLYAVLYALLKMFSVCSLSYGVLLLFLYPLLLCEAAAGLAHVLRQQRREETARIAGIAQERNLLGQGSAGGGDVDVDVGEGDPECGGEINWSSFAVLLPLLAFAIGLLTSLMGIGGGELIGPLLLTLKAAPSASSATTSFMSLLNASSSVLHYLLLGEIPFGYAAGMFVIGALGGISGRAGALYISIHYGRSSVMVFALAAVLLVSFFMYFSYVVADSSDFQFTSICSR